MLSLTFYMIEVQSLVLNSGGNIDSILMSLPPEAKWK